MNSRMSKLGWIVGTLLVASLVLAGSIVDQGKPGTQGAWPVTLASGTWVPDGGYIGSVSISTDGGIIGKVSIVMPDGGPVTGGWEQIATFDVSAYIVANGGLPTTQELAFGYDGTSTLTVTRRAANATGADNAVGFALSDFGGNYQQFRIAWSMSAAPTGGSITPKSRLYTSRAVALNEATAGNFDMTSDYTGGTTVSLWVWSSQFYVAAPYSNEIHVGIAPFWTWFLTATTATVTACANCSVELWGLR